MSVGETLLRRNQERQDRNTIQPKNKRALSFAGIIVKRVNHKGIPARRIIGFPPADQEAAIKVIQEHLKWARNQRR